ncbi:MAG: STAS domain-containing protein [Oscillospiraceae bacterium]|nr:STAS domain-containing protein [Oscillospiraceae bacterium]
MTIALEGRLDTVTAPDLEKSLKESIEGVSELVMDFEKLDYISSAGLRVLLGAHKTMSKKGGMKVVNANEMVKEVFDVTGFADILDIE